MLFSGTALAILVVRLFFYFVTIRNAKEELKTASNEHVVVRNPKSYIVVGIICTVVFGILATLMIHFLSFSEFKKVIWVFILFAGGFLLGLYLIVESVVRRIDLYKNEHYFVYSPVFGKPRIIYYSDCICYNVNRNAVFFWTDKRRFRIDNFCTNSSELLNMLQKNRVKPKRITK